MEKEQKLKKYMAWFHASWINESDYTAEFTYYYGNLKYKSIVISRSNFPYITKYVLEPLIDKANELDLSLFVQYEGRLEIEIS